MNRRAHLKTLLAGGMALAAAPWVLGCSRESPSPSEALRASDVPRRKIGIQLFMVRDLLQKDARGTLTALSGIGFSELEMFGFGGGSVFIEDPFFGLNLAEFKQLTADLGLAIPTVHYSGNEEQVPANAELALELGASHLIRAMAPDFITRTPEGAVVSGVRDAEQMQRIAADLNRLGAACKASGIGFAYHNHHMEFAQLGEANGYDILLAETDPALVQMEMDIGWARAAGVDGVDYLERFPGRFIACHLKDFNPALPLPTASATAPIPEMTQMVPPGEGIIDFARALSVMGATGVQHGYIEVDLPQGDPLALARTGHDHLAAALAAI